MSKFKVGDRVVLTTDMDGRHQWIDWKEHFERKTVGTIDEISTGELPISVKWDYYDGIDALDSSVNEQSIRHATRLIHPSFLSGKKLTKPKNGRQ
jgi:hypothetical protein